MAHNDPLDHHLAEYHRLDSLALNERAAGRSGLDYLDAAMRHAAEIARIQADRAAVLELARAH